MRNGDEGGERVKGEIASIKMRYPFGIGNEGR